MRIHSLNCATGFPLGIRLFPRRFQGEMVTHVLLIEHADRTKPSLTLIDSGLSAAELEDPRRLGSFARALRFQPEPERAAVAQIRALGLDPARVTDIVLTHLDLDHAGGLVDFPEARIHVHPAELTAARARRTFGERLRYRPQQWSRARWTEWGEGEDEEGEDGEGVEPIEVEALPGISGIPLEGVAGGGLFLVPLFGHTRGHCGVLITGVDPPLLHCGDAYYDHSERTLPSSIFFDLFRRNVHVDAGAARESLARLDLFAAARPELQIFATHDPAEFVARTGSSR